MVVLVVSHARRSGEVGGYTRCEPVHNVHEAKRRRAKVVAENRRTGDSTFRVSISSGSNERTSSSTFRATGVTRAELFEHSAVLGWLQRHPSSTRVQGRLVRPPSSIPWLRGRFDPFEYSAVLRRARAAISSQLCAPRRARAATSSHFAEQGPGSSYQGKQIATFLQPRQTKTLEHLSPAKALEHPKHRSPRWRRQFQEYIY